MYRSPLREQGLQPRHQHATALQRREPLRETRRFTTHLARSLAANGGPQRLCERAATTATRDVVFDDPEEGGHRAEEGRLSVAALLLLDLLERLHLRLARGPALAGQAALPVGDLAAIALEPAV